MSDADLASKHQEASTLSSNQIPLEIWEEVFVYCLPHRNDFIRPSAGKAPLLLCQVNRAWRAAVTKSMPRLWASLFVKIRREGCSPHTELITTWLARAGSHPLSIALMFDGRPGLAAFTNVDAAMRCLLPFFATWKFVVIQVGPFLRNLDTFKVLGPDAMANHLTGLDIFLPGTYRDAADDMDLLLHRAPFLRCLQLSAEVLGSDIPDLRIPFEKLTSLSLNTSVFSIDNCVAVLEQCPNLVSFDTSLLEGNFKNVRRGPPTILRQLEELRLGTTTQHLNIFFDHFTFPSLVKLFCICQYPFPAHSFVSLINRSACILSTLGLYTDLTEDNLLKCLHVCPSLEELDLQTTNSHFVTDHVLEKLTFGPCEGPLCPMLEKMTFGSDVIHSSDGIFARMVQSRFLTGPRHLVLIIAMGWLDNEDIACLKKLKELGLLGCWRPC